MSIELDPQSQQALDTAIQRLADASGVTAKDVLKAQMRLLAVDLAYNTQPIGKDASSQARNQAKIERRILAVYLSVGAAVSLLKEKNEGISVAFSRAVRNGNYAQAAALLNRYSGASATYNVGPFDGGTLHKQQRRSNKISRRLVVIDDKSIKAYLTATKKLVGFAKGGFAEAARQLGGARGIPGYATRQRAPGSGIITGDGRSLTVTMTNDVRYIREALDPAAETRAVNNRTRNIDLVIKRMMDRRIAEISRSLQ